MNRVAGICSRTRNSISERSAPVPFGDPQASSVSATTRSEVSSRVLTPGTFSPHRAGLRLAKRLVMDCCSLSSGRMSAADAAGGCTVVSAHSAVAANKWKSLVTGGGRSIQSSFFSARISANPSLSGFFHIRSRSNLFRSSREKRSVRWIRLLSLKSRSWNFFRISTRSLPK